MGEAVLGLDFLLGGAGERELGVAQLLQPQVRVS